MQNREHQCPHRRGRKVAQTGQVTGQRWCVWCVSEPRCKPISFISSPVSTLAEMLFNSGLRQGSEGRGENKEATWSDRWASHSDGKPSWLPHRPRLKETKRCSTNRVRHTWSWDFPDLTLTHPAASSLRSVCPQSPLRSDTSPLTHLIYQCVSSERGPQGRGETQVGTVTSFHTGTHITNRGELLSLAWPGPAQHPCMLSPGSHPTGTHPGGGAAVLACPSPAWL